MNTPLEQMHALMQRGGEEGFSQEVISALTTDFSDTIVDIKPNGTIFISHGHYRDCLDRAFGPGGWCLIPLGVPSVEGSRVIWYGFLKARGQYIEQAYGGCTYIRSNSEMSYDDCVEGAKSDCLTRCCKALPMFRKLWDRIYVDYWKATYAEVGRHQRYGDRPYWKKIGVSVPGWTARPDRQGVPEGRRPPRVEDENQRHIDAIAKPAVPLHTIPNPDWDEADFADDSRE